MGIPFSADLQVGTDAWDAILNSSYSAALSSLYEWYITVSGQFTSASSRMVVIYLMNLETNFSFNQDLAEYFSANLSI